MMQGCEMFNEGIQVKEVKACLLCGNEGVSLYQGLRDSLFGAPGVWSLIRCPQCGLVWLNPRPVLEDIGKLYENYFTHDHNIGDRVGRFAGLRRAIRDAVLVSCLGYNELNSSLPQRVLGKILGWVGPIREMVELSVMTLKRNPNGKLLDVGCGNGQFLVKMRDLGWEVMGVEPDRQAVKVAREQFGLSIHEGTIEESSFPDDTFDAITMNHVIEHVPDQIGLLVECRRILRPGGTVVVVTPNLQSLGCHVFNVDWRGWEVPRHLAIFSPNALRLCAERAGLQVAKLWTTSRVARWMWAASYLIRRNGTLPGGSPQRQNLRLRLKGLAFQTVEYGLCRMRDVGEEIVLVATK